ncbi:MAG: GNAT family N-acetyltransferase [Variovorax sp.]|nr:MAG: GNAT family N-acetyltransferase [Variovorax sp.]
MEILAGRPGHLAPRVMDDLGRYRHKVFVETLGWELVTEEGKERDQFDGEETIYLAARDQDENIIGTGRLLPTTGPYLLGDVFPELMGGVEVPRDPRVWELSRFAAVDFTSPLAGALGQFSSEVTIALFHSALNVAEANGAERIITVSPLGVERLLRRKGIKAHRAAPPMIVGGHPIFACWIDIAGSERQR